MAERSIIPSEAGPSLWDGLPALGQHSQRLTVRVFSLYGLSLASSDLQFVLPKIPFTDSSEHKMLT